MKNWGVSGDPPFRVTAGLVLLHFQLDGRALLLSAGQVFPGAALLPEVSDITATDDATYDWLVTPEQARCAVRPLRWAMTQLRPSSDRLLVALELLGGSWQGTQEDVALLTGMTREVATKYIGDACRTGFLESGRRQLTLTETGKRYARMLIGGA
jgi:hypothetical protein